LLQSEIDVFVNFVLYFQRKSKLRKACTFEIGAFCTSFLACCILAVVVGTIFLPSLMFLCTHLFATSSVTFILMKTLKEKNLTNTVEKKFLEFQNM